ncbi:TolC family protein [Methylovulum psychrotolerans]|uniref:Protein CyaE n=1 Tax=Methylovulum psychrotolerans TaxID=1704499 RepID=A0A2S5CKN2_9GAMM|nr:TolC family protein [Methylovulum psychrotolerans]POZ51371.1 TolC family protein [Methylovulum psychrotolerans]
MKLILWAGLGMVFCPLVGNADQNSRFADPFATHRQVSPSPGQQQHGADDPCRLNPISHPAWTLVDVVNQALCFNPQTRLAWANARYQAGQVGIAKAAYLPTVTLTTSLSRGINSSSSSNLQSTTISNTSSGSAAQAINRFTPVISLNYLLYNFGGREAVLETAQKTLEASNWTQDAVLQTVMFSAIQAYYQVFASQAAADASLVSENATGEALKAAKTRHEIGAAALADALLAQTAFAQARLNHQKTAGEARVASGSLANALGLEADYPLQIAPPSVPKPSREQDHNIHQLIALAKTLRPDLAAAEATIQAAEASVKAAEAGHLPSLSLVGTVGYNQTSLPSETQSWTVGLQISVPLFTGFNVTYQVRSAKEKLDVQRANFDQLDQTVSLDVWKAYQLVNIAHDTFKSSEDLLASAFQAERVAMGRYKAGAGNIIDLLSAQASHATARLQIIQAQYTWLTQKAQLAQALGRLDFASLPSR